MAKLSLSIFDPIEIVISGQSFFVDRISSKMLGDLQAASDKMTNPENANAEAMGDLLMKAIPGMSKEAAMEIDIRHVPKIVAFLAEQINVAMEPPKAGEQKN